MYSVVGFDGQVYGPVDLKTLEQWIAQGRVNADTNIIEPLSGRVIKAAMIPELAVLLPQAAPPVNPHQNPAGQFNIPGPQGRSPVQINNIVGMTPSVYHQALGVGAPKSRLIAGLLALFLGTLGIHQFYLGKNGLGVLMLLITVLTCGWGAILTALWALIDAILCFTGATTDAQGRALE